MAIPPYQEEKNMSQHIQPSLELLKNYFDKIYVVSIERTRQHRLEKVKENLNGVDFEFFEGTDATLLSKEELNEIADLPRSATFLDEFFMMRYGHKANRPLHKSEIGCSYSHVRIYQEMLEKNYQRVLIFEDDAKIDSRYINLIPVILSEIPKDCELLYWGYRWFDSESNLRRWIRILFQSPLRILISKMAGKKNLNSDQRYPSPYKEHIWNSGLHAGTHAYSITKKGAAKMLKVNFPVVMNADQAITYLHQKNEMKCYVTVPLIFRDDQSVPTSLNV